MHYSLQVRILPSCLHSPDFNSLFVLTIVICYWGLCAVFQWKSMGNISDIIRCTTIVGKDKRHSLPYGATASCNARQTPGPNNIRKRVKQGFCKAEIKHKNVWVKSKTNKQNNHSCCKIIVWGHHKRWIEKWTQGQKCVSHRQWKIKWEKGKEEKRKQNLARSSPLRVACLVSGRAGLASNLFWPRFLDFLMQLVCVEDLAVSCSGSLGSVVDSGGQNPRSRRPELCCTGLCIIWPFSLTLQLKCCSLVVLVRQSIPSFNWTV